MPFSGPREDHLAIRELYETYADGASRRDRATWLGCYAPSARWTTHYFDLIGTQAIGDRFDTIMEPAMDVTFSLQFGSIAVMGQRAHCTTYQTESLLYPDGSTYELVGRYEDELVRLDGHWRFLVRTYHVKRERMPGAGTPRFAGPIADKLAIRELHATYADAATRQDKAQWLGCWTEDAV